MDTCVGVCKHTVLPLRIPFPLATTVNGAQRSRDPTLQTPQGLRRLHPRLYLSTWWQVSRNTASFLPLSYPRCPPAGAPSSGQRNVYQPAPHWRRDATEICRPPPTIYQSVRPTSRRGGPAAVFQMYLTVLSSSNSVALVLQMPIAERLSI